LKIGTVRLVLSWEGKVPVEVLRFKICERGREIS
jgi:hypothetical protein